MDKTPFKRAHINGSVPIYHSNEALLQVVSSEPLGRGNAADNHSDECYRGTMARESHRHPTSFSEAFDPSFIYIMYID